MITKEQAQAFAKEYNVDEHAAFCLMQFIQNRLNILIEQNQLDLIDTREKQMDFITYCVTEWNRIGKEFYNRLLNPKTQEDEEFKKEFINQMYDELRAKANA